MRDIKFRAKIESDNEWVYGWVYKHVNGYRMKVSTEYREEIFRVQKETIGQFTRATR